MKAKTNNIIWFKLIALLIPFLFLFLFEMSLRLFHVGYDLSLFIDHPENPEYRIFNPNVSLRYFTEEQNSTRGFIEPFKKEKELGTIRIFVQGGSTAYGFPYENNGSFHRMLQYQFNQNFPDKKIEIINLSLTAVNSYTLLDFADEIIRQQPDAILIYAGHNEYYGALGVGSSSKLGQSPWLVKIGIQFRKLRLGQLVANLFSRSPVDEKSALSENLMKRMAEERSIPQNSVLFNKGLKQFQNNMSSLLSKYQKNQTPVFIGTVVSNLKDQPPFVSGNDSSSNAAFFYNRAKELESESDYEQAQKFYIQAKDADQLRFCAPEAINESILNLTKDYGAVLVPVKKGFEEFSPNGIVGKELMLEHLHPNLRGYYVMANCFGNILSGNLKDLQSKPYKSILFEEMPVTEMDSLYGAYTNLILRSQWPFNEPMPDIDVTGKSMPEVLAGGLAVKKITWNEAMQKLQKHYLEEKNYQGLLKVAESLALAYPLNYNYQYQAGQFSANLNEYKKAFSYFNDALEIKPNMELVSKIVKAALNAKMFEELLMLLGSEKIEGLGNQLVSKIERDVSLLKYYELILQGGASDQTTYEHLVNLYYGFGIYDEARKNANKLLELQPNNELAMEVIKRTNQAVRK